MGRNKNGVSGAANFRVNGVSSAYVPGAVYFLVGSALVAMAALHASGLAEVGGEWASASRWAAQPVGSIGHRLLVAISLLFVAASIWRLAKRCAAVEGRTELPIVCAVCGLKIRALQDSEEDDIVGETNDVQKLKEELKYERQRTKDAREDLEKDRRAAEAAMNEVTTKNKILEGENGRLLMQVEHLKENMKMKRMGIIQILESRDHEFWNANLEAPVPV